MRQFLPQRGNQKVLVARIRGDRDQRRDFKSLSLSNGYLTGLTHVEDQSTSILVPFRVAAASDPCAAL